MDRDQTAPGAVWSWFIVNASMTKSGLIKCIWTYAADVKSRQLKREDLDLILKVKGPKA